MKPSIFIRSEGAIAAPMSRVFEVAPGESQTLFAHGLDGSEAVALALLSNDVEPDDAEEGDWLSVDLLNVGGPVLFLERPGVYRLSIAESAGAVRVGAY